MPAISLSGHAEPETAAGTWAPGPLRPRLTVGAIHIWRADLTAVSDDFVELLSHRERARAERFPRTGDARLWARSRGVLRALLGRYMSTDPRALCFVAGAHGKPALLDEPAGSRATPLSTTMRPSLSFNLSHAGYLALFALTQTDAVGVDVEIARRAIDEVAIADRAFRPAVAERLRQLDPIARREEFLRAWVRHEAWLKWRGTGIGELEAFPPQRPPWIGDLDLGRLAAGAVAFQHEPRALLCWDWWA